MCTRDEYGNGVKFPDNEGLLFDVYYAICYQPNASYLHVYVDIVEALDINVFFKNTIHNSKWK